MYQKGEQKRDLILTNAKTLFYEKGFKNTTIKEIAAMSNDPVSLIHYYFDKKENIIRQIYHDFQGSVDLFVYSHCPNSEEDVFLAHAINQRIYYDIILTDPANAKVYDEALETYSNANLIRGYIEHVYRKCMDQFQVQIPDSVFQAYMLMDFGARGELFAEYFSGNIILDTQDMVGWFIRVYPQLLGIDAKYINEIVENSYQIYRNLDFRHLKFLI